MPEEAEKDEENEGMTTVDVDEEEEEEEEKTISLDENEKDQLLKDVLPNLIQIDQNRRMKELSEDCFGVLA